MGRVLIALGALALMACGSNTVTGPGFWGDGYVVPAANRVPPCRYPGKLPAIGDPVRLPDGTCPPGMIG